MLILYTSPSQVNPCLHGKIDKNLTPSHLTDPGLEAGNPAIVHLFVDALTRVGCQPGLV